MNRFATVVENASGATTKDVSSAGQATASPAKGEKNTTKDAKINLQNELVNLLCFDVVEQYHNNKLLFDKYYEKMLKRRKSSKIINCDVIIQKGPILLKVYREDGTIEVIANFKTRMEYLDQTEKELKIDFNKPLKEQDPLNELNELAKEPLESLKFLQCQLFRFLEDWEVSSLCSCTETEEGFPSHEVYQNTIELPDGSNVVPLRLDTIRLVQNGCSFNELRFEDPNQHLKDFLKLVDSHDLDVAIKERSVCIYFNFPFSIKLAIGLNREIDCATGGKLRDKNPKESWEIIKNHALYDHEGWNDSRDFVRLVKAISLSQNTSKTLDRRLLELEDQINFLLNEPQTTPKTSSTYIPKAYAEAVSSDPHPQNLDGPPRKNSFAFQKRVRPNPQPQALEPSFEAQVQGYMETHTERMEIFKKAIFKQRRKSTIELRRCMAFLKNSQQVELRKKALVIDRKEETEGGADDETVRNAKKEPEEELVEMRRSQSLGYYLKHEINKKLIEGLIGNQSCNDSLLAVQLGKMDNETYDSM
ncbi:hypothetical protein Tco_0031848 [Tanacetum coccineum]